ncbi:MAG: MarR family transcriptional regulator [Steroidobacteraceae bacterium]|jgi:DNA-binding MarR family transcriptional regulator
MSANDEQLREAIELFYFAYRAFTGGPDGILAVRRLGRVHHRILYFVGRNPRLAVQDLLGILAVSKQALNAPLRRLQAQGLIAAQADERDRRIKRLSLTPAGRRLEAQLTGTQMRRLAAVFAAQGERSEAAWRSVMRAMTRPRK